MIVLAWLAKEPSHWQAFVSNRVSEIQSTIPFSQWGHVSGKENPADLVSRGVSCDILGDSSLWWAGPQWLSQSHETAAPSYDASDQEIQNLVEAEAKRHKGIRVNISSCGSIDLFENLINRYSSISKVERTLAYCLRFLNNCRKKPDERILSGLTQDEIHRANERLIEHVQEVFFEDEIKRLRQNKCIKTSSTLLSLHPFLDNHGLLRVGGRLHEAPWSFERKHPVLLPEKHRFTNLIFKAEHLRLLHAGPQALLAAIRVRYWPLNGRNLARRIFHECIICYKTSPKPLNQIMGSLPSSRVQSSRPFLITGVDFAGPITTLVNKGRGRKTTKSYVALFICFSTKAIHLEATSELSSAAFLATLRRFVARRGCPQRIHSDNATNFVGTNRELGELYEFIENEVKNTSNEFLNQQKIEWSFIPPRSPHMGGLWEAGIKSCKFHLKRVMGQSLFTFEEFSTALTQIEACLNSRPLCPLSSNPDDLEPLTPGHFLIGESITCLPDIDVTEVKLNRLERWQHIQRNVQDFWKRWSLEYISNLQGRSKWKTSQKDLAINDLVMLQDENLPPLKWKLGRVIELHPSTDKKVRVVTVKTETSTTKRAVAKLCKLPIDN